MTTFNSHLFGGPVASGSDPTTDQKEVFEKDASINHSGSEGRSTRVRITAVPTSAAEQFETNSKHEFPSDFTEDASATVNHSWPGSEVNVSSCHTDESLESRIQKLLRINCLNATSSRNESTLPECTSFPHTTLNSAHSHDLHSVSPTDVAKDAGDCSSTTTIDGSQYHTYTQDSYGHKHEIISSSFSRRTLLPTPDESNEKTSSAVTRGANSATNRVPLLKTPSKPLDYVEINMITQDLFTLFVDELKEIMHRDITRRIVEGKAFKIFSSWWDSTNDQIEVRFCST